MIEIILETLVAVLLVVTVIYCYVLNRRLATLRDSQAEMVQLLDDFAVAMEKAQSGVSELRQVSASIGKELQQRVSAARALSDELRVMTQSDDDLANRLEKGLIGRQSNDKPVEDDPADRESERSESESVLLAALRRAK